MKQVYTRRLRRLLERAGHQPWMRSRLWRWIVFRLELLQSRIRIEREKRRMGKGLRSFEELAHESRRTHEAPGR